MATVSDQSCGGGHCHIAHTIVTVQCPSGSSHALAVRGGWLWWRWRGTHAALRGRGRVECVDVAVPRMAQGTPGEYI